MFFIEALRFTSLFESMAILFLEGSKNISKTSLGLRISWSEMNTIMKRAVRQGLARRKNETIKHIGMDEKSFLKGHRYISVMVDIDERRVLDVAVDLKKYMNEAVDKVRRSEHQLCEPAYKSNRQRV